MYDLFAVVTPGLESISWEEIKLLGLNPLKKETGGISLQGYLESIYSLNLLSRTISRVLVRLGKFHAAAFSELRKKAGRLSWEEFIVPGQTISIRATCHHSRLYHSKAVEERVLGAISDRLGEKTKIQESNKNNSNNPDHLIVVRLSNDECLISIDTSGENLHRRGYRLQTAKAPIRENIAAAIILATGWDRHKPLLDPFCGSGTIPIEAALMSRNIPPGLNRHFSFMRWINFNKSIWNQIIESIKMKEMDHGQVIQGSDRDEGAIQISQKNADRAGVSDLIEFRHNAISAIHPPKEPGFLITNPPYGMRIRSNKDIRNLYAQLGNTAKLYCQNWQVGILSSDPTLFSQLGFAVDTSVHFSNGGINVILGKGFVPEYQ
jgi:putative N6-adenine-specific DNA methylase